MQHPLSLSSFLLLCATAAAQVQFRPTRVTPLPIGSYPSQMASGDVDGDGDLDLVVANDFWDTQVLINDGNGGFVDETAGRMVSPWLQDSTCIDLADIDGPGIAADQLLHFAWEMFREPDLLLATHRQRLLAAQVAEAGVRVFAPGRRRLAVADKVDINHQR